MRLQLIVANPAKMKPAVDHIDLIGGDVTGLAEKGTPAYDKDTNDSTRVVATFTSEDWTTDANGYNVITYDLPKASKDQYFRLRGTNLGMNVPGETLDGNPLIDPKRQQLMPQPASTRLTTATTKTCGSTRILSLWIRPHTPMSKRLMIHWAS